MKIAHLSDIHIHNLKKHDEYRILFSRLYDSLKVSKPDIIVIVGDLYESWIEISNEAETLASNFLDNLSKIATTYITYGNHDCRKKNKNRLNSVESLIKVMNNPNIKYLGKTDFYDIDSTYIFVNYEHLDKQNNPWDNIEKDYSKIYIGLFHDPIYQSKTYLGETFDNRYKPITFFEQNDFLFLGDIHMLQYFRNNNSAAYCSSLIQQSHGESPNNHGYILWDIESRDVFKSSFHEIYNEYNYITFNIEKGFDYNNIHLKSEFINNNSTVKVKWRDIAAIVDDRDIRNRIENHIKTTFNVDNCSFSRTSILKNIGEINIDENLDILDNENMKQIFVEYLTINKYEQKIIDKILEYDLIINERLNHKSDNNNTNWSIISCWFNNFKIYGDDNYLNLQDKKGIIQINGDNQAGKTTILDAITYVLYGTTISTNNKKKHGDKRYINKNRNLDTCDAGIVIRINDKHFTLIRKTERKWSSDGSKITSCPTVLDIYNGLDITEENKLTEELKKDTQLFIEKSIGNFDDFVRIVLTTADNLNNLLSMDRAVFIDSVSKDAGFDIFDKKLNEYKDYYKEICSDFIKINVDSLISDNKQLAFDIEDINQKIVNVDNNLINTNKQKSLLEDKKDLLSNSIQQIEPEIENINISDLNHEIEKCQSELTNLYSIVNELELLEKDIKIFDYSLIENIDKILNTKNKEISDNEKEISEIKLKISGIENNILSLNNDKNNHLVEAKNTLLLKSKDYENELISLRSNFSEKISNYTLYIKEKISEINISKSKYDSKVNELRNNKLNTIEQNEILEKSKICPTCERELDTKDLLVINKRVDNNKILISEIDVQIKNIEPLYDNLSKKISEYEHELNDISKHIYPEELNILLEESKKQATIIKKEISDIETILKNDSIEIDSTIEDNKIKSYNKEKDSLNLLLNNKIIIIDKTNNEINENIIIKNNLLEEKKKYDEIKEKINKKDSYLLIIEKNKYTINNNKESIEKKNKSLKVIEQNIIIKNDIQSVNILLDDINSKIYQFNNEKTSLKFEKERIENKISENNSLIERDKYQKESEYYLSIYKKCVHRDGLPSFLLRKSINIINDELRNLLDDVDFDIFFNDELILELVHDITPNQSIECVTSSGMERTFSAIVLKLALRKINTKSKPSFLIFDEIMGKLNKKNVEKFNNLIEQIKLSIDNIIIIEHQNMINYDYIIDVKSENGVSRFEIN